MILVVMFVLSTLMTITIRTIHLAIKTVLIIAASTIQMSLMMLMMTIQAMMLRIMIQAGETGAVTIYSGAIWALV